MDKMSIYNAVRSCPPEALKEIEAGRLKGKSDINPMWRIQILTEMFGPCGVGWYYEIDRQWTEQGANGEVAAFCNISLYIKEGENWSKPIKGTGGAAFIANERNGAYTSDECFKMALTDAISVSCKALGVAADVYWAQGRTKYDQPREQPTQPTQPTVKKITATTAKLLNGLIEETKADKPKLMSYYGVSDVSEMTQDQAKHCIDILQKRASK